MPRSVEDASAIARDSLAEDSVAMGETLEGFAELMGRRVARLERVAERLKRSGAEAPQVAAVEAAAASYAALHQTATEEALRRSRRPRPRPNEWLALGRVVDADRKPVSGVRVRLFDRDRKYHDLLGDTETDELGDFAAVYHERDFAEAGEELPELYVMVEDAAGTTLAESTEPVSPHPAGADYFEIVLPAERRRAKRSVRKTSGRRATRGTRRRDR